MELKHQKPNEYTIKPLNVKGPMHMVNQQQLFYLKKSQGNTNSLHQAPDTTVPITLTKKAPKKYTPQPSLLYGTRFKTKVNTISLGSSSEDEESFGIRALIGSLIRYLDGCRG